MATSRLIPRLNFLRSNVRRSIFIWPIYLLATSWMPAANAADFNGYLTLTTDYVFRGVSYSDSGPAVQLGGDVSFSNGLFVGAWASTVDISNGPSRQRDLEINYYAGYGFALNKNWSANITAVAYTYPGATGEIDYGYEELSATLNFDDRFWIEYAYSPDLYRTGYTTQNIEAYGELSLPHQYVFGAGIGRYDTSDLTGRAYNYWQAGISKAISIILLDLRYHDTSDWVPIISTPDRAEARLVLSARFRF